jgi:hypothetical protein
VCGANVERAFSKCNSKETSTTLMKLKKNFLYWVPLATSMVLYAYVISPVLRSGYMEDDRFDSIWAVTRKAAGVSGIRDGLEWTKIYVSGLGRFHPLAHILGAVTFEITNLHTFKLISFIATLMAVFLIAIFLVLWTSRREIAILFLLALSGVSQFRVTYDPILSFGLHTKILVILLGLQLLVLAKMKKDQNPKVSIYILFLVLLICSGLYHEISVMAFLALVPLALTFTKRKRATTIILISWTFVSYWVIRVTLYFSKQSTGLAFYQVQKNPLTVAKTYFQQVSGLVPFFSTRDWANAGWGNYAIPFAVVVIIGILALYLVLRYSEGNSLILDDMRGVGLCGLLLVLLPGSVEALSEGHANIGRWWDGYLNVWVMQIGLAIAIAALTVKLRGRGPEWVRSKLAITVICVLVLMIVPIKRINDTVVDRIPQWTQSTAINGWEREQTVRAIRDGFLDSRPSIPQLISLPPRVWMSNDYLETLSPDVTPLANSWGRFSEMPNSVLYRCQKNKEFKFASSVEKTYRCQNAYGAVFSSFATSFKDGYSIIGEPIQITLSDNPLKEQFRKNMNQTLIKGIKIFVSGRYKECKYMDAKGTDGLTKKYQLKFDTGKHYLLSNPESIVDLNTLKMSNCD